MSIGTAMVLIALGVFFYLKPAIFKVTAKWSAVAVAVAAVGLGGWYLYDQYKSHSAVGYVAADGTHPNGPWLDFWPGSTDDPCAKKDADNNISCSNLVDFMPAPNETPAAYLKRMPVTCHPSQPPIGWSLPVACEKVIINPATAKTVAAWEKSPPVAVPGNYKLCDRWLEYIRKEDRPEFCLLRINKDTGKVEDLSMFGIPNKESKP